MPLRTPTRWTNAAALENCAAAPAHGPPRCLWPRQKRYSLTVHATMAVNQQRVMMGRLMYHAWQKF